MFLCGGELAPRYASETRPLTAGEPGLEKHVRRVAAGIALHAHRPSLTVLPDHNLANTFPLCGGPVYIGESMLDLMANEHELASADP